MNDPKTPAVQSVNFKSGGEIRTPLIDTMGNKLIFITEFHGPYRKFYAEYVPVVGDPSTMKAICWQGDSELDQLHEAKVKQQIERGWKKL